MRLLLGLFLLVGLAGCGTATGSIRLDTGQERPLVFKPRDSSPPQELNERDFVQGVAKASQHIRPSQRPMQEAQRLFDVPQRRGKYLYEVGGRRLIPLGIDGQPEPELAREDTELARAYLSWCERTLRPGDCLRLLGSGALLDGDGRYALAMAIAQGSVLDATRQAFRDMADPEAMMATVLCAATGYMLLWALPEPVSKGIAATLTIGLMGYLGFDTVWRLITGWVALVEEVDHATTFEEIRTAGERYGKVMGENAARIFVMLATAAVGSTAAELASRLPTLPGAGSLGARLAMNVGVRHEALAQVHSVTVQAEGAIIALAPGAVAMAAQGMGDLPRSSPRHHIATNKNTEAEVRGGPWTPRFQRIFNRAKMSLDDEANIVEVEGHQGPHPEEYHRLVFQRLDDVTTGCRNVQQCREALVRELRALAKEISTPGTELNRLVTKLTSP